ncbi:hypothetical protein [Halothermothrix orenii]|uniref:hypothetical protein n=1 Tax=Halothermothrix orenii TaxID=31909 RepID=UPI00059F6805|nr:hypothetical protein [Halothermothrix orenii]
MKKEIYIKACWGVIVMVSLYQINTNQQIKKSNSNCKNILPQDINQPLIIVNSIQLDNILKQKKLISVFNKVVKKVYSYISSECIFILTDPDGIMLSHISGQDTKSYTYN